MCRTVIFGRYRIFVVRLLDQVEWKICVFSYEFFFAFFANVSFGPIDATILDGAISCFFFNSFDSYYSIDCVGCLREVFLAC